MPKKKYGFKSNCLGILLAFATYSCGVQHSEDPKILVFSKTVEWYHESIPAGNKALMQLGADNGIKVDTTTNSELFTDRNLEGYSAVVFLSTTGDVFNEEQQEALKKYLRNGGGFVGIHGASDTEHDWEWYGKLVGGYFKNHPEIQEAVLQVVDKAHPSTAHLPAQWIRTDEWYNFTNLNKDVNVLITIDEDSYEGGENGQPHPMAWYHNYDGGRVFYTALGHGAENFKEPMLLQHILGGIEYAIGKK